MPITASAPGKVMVSGEYAVLSGAPALVLAVDARARVTLLSDALRDRSADPGHGSLLPRTLPPEVMLAKEHAERRLGLSSMDLTIDTTALNHGARKLGLGSSAAGAVAAAAAVFARAGIDPAKERSRVFASALAGHHAVAPQGSGADVAASAFGGLIAFQRDPSHQLGVDAASLDRITDAITITPRAMPSSVAITLVWTGSPVRTSDLVARVKRLAAADPKAHRLAIAAIEEASVALSSGIAADDAPAIFEAVHAHHEAMRALGDAADTPIVTPALAALDRLARAHGGAAKPSGAGGGDVALLFLPVTSSLDAMSASLAETELTVLSLPLFAEGARLDGAAYDHVVNGG